MTAPDNPNPVPLAQKLWHYEGFDGRHVCQPHPNGGSTVLFTCETYADAVHAIELHNASLALPKQEEREKENVADLACGNQKGFMNPIRLKLATPFASCSPRMLFRALSSIRRAQPETVGTSESNFWDNEKPLVQEDGRDGTLMLYAAHPSGKGAYIGTGKTFSEAIDSAMKAERETSEGEEK